jgi:hypothetical protein
VKSRFRGTGKSRQFGVSSNPVKPQRAKPTRFLSADGDLAAIHVDHPGLLYELFAESIGFLSPDSSEADIIVDVVDPRTDIFASEASPMTVIIGSGADLVIDIIVIMATLTGSHVVLARQLNPQMTAYQRMLKFG